MVKKRAEEVVAAARLRLLNDTDMAIDVFERLMQPGSGEAVALKAAELVLNYNGLKQPDQVDVTISTGDDPAQLVRERLERLALGAAGSTSSSSRLEEDDIIDAEVLPEQDTLF